MVRVFSNIEPKTFIEVIKQCAPDRNAQAAIGHFIIARDRFSLAICKFWIWYENDIEELVPVRILAGRFTRLNLDAYIKNPRQNEILESTLEMTIRTDMPSEAVVGKCVWSDIPP